MAYRRSRHRRHHKSKKAGLRRSKRATRKGGLKDVKLAKMGEKSQTPKPQSKKRVSGHEAEAAASCVSGVCRGLGALLSGGRRRTKRAGLKRSKKGGLKRGGMSTIGQTGLHVSAHGYSGLGMQNTTHIHKSRSPHYHPHTH